MKIGRREFAKLAGVGTLLPWLMPGVLAAARNAPGACTLMYDRWIACERQAVYEPNDNCWHPQLVRTKRGDLLLSVIVGGKGRTMVLRSQDEGKTWSKPELVAADFEVEGGGGWGMAVLASGRIVMSYLDISPWPRLPAWPPASEPRKIGMWPDKGLRPWGWTPAMTKLILRSVHSDDDGRTWELSKPIQVAPWLAAIPHGSGPIFEVGGTIYMPVWAWFSEEDSGNCALLESKDGGLSWAPGSVIARADKSRKVEYREVCVQVLPGGEWLAICRANSPNDYGLLNVSMHTTRSLNGGKTWTRPEPTFVALGYPRMLLLPDGGLMAYGSYSEGIRNWFSYNQGESWAFEDILYSRDARHGLGLLDRGAPSALVIDDRRVLVTYYAVRDQSINWGWMDPTNRVESVWLRRVPNDARELIAR